MSNLPQPKDVTTELLEQFGDEVITTTANFGGELTYHVAAPQIVEVCRFLRDTPGLLFKQLSDIAGIDYYQQEEAYQFGRFALNYHLLSIVYARRIRLKVFWDDGAPPIPSVTVLWRSAEWEEREAYDMFGIPFDGNPDMRRLLMPDDWQGHPQRKDYPLGYETVQFSFNYDEVNKHKPYAQE